MAKRALAKPVHEMTVIDRAAHVLKFDQRKVELAELAAKSERITEITNAAGYQECHSARVDLKNTRVAIQKSGKEAREDATAFSKAVIAKEKELIDVIGPEENRLQVLQDGWDADRQAEKAEKLRIQQEQVERERLIVEATRSLPLQAIGKTADQVQVLLDCEADRDFDEIPESVRSMVRGLSAEAVAKLIAMRDEKVAAEAETKRLADERAALEQQRKDQAAAQEELDRKAKADREEQDRAAAAERKRLADEAQAARDLEAAADKERRDAEQRARDADQAEQRRKQDEAAETLRRERQEFEDKRALAEKAERDHAIAEATLISAAGEVVVLLTDSGFETHVITLKLSAALNRETQQQEAA